MIEQNTFQINTLLLVFITYLNGYLYTKFQGSVTLKKILIFNVITGVLALGIIYISNTTNLYKWLIIISLGLLYNSSFLMSFIRKIPLLKVFYVGFTWGVMNAWLILPEFNSTVLFISWLYITALVLPFDIRDMEQDNIITFPKIIGVQNTKYMAYVLIFFAVFIGIPVLEVPFSIALFLGTLVSYVMIYFSEKTKKDLYFSFGIELCVGLPFLFYVLLKYF